jgi:hypothetical protein
VRAAARSDLECVHEADQRAVRLQPERPDLAQQPPPAVPRSVGGGRARIANVAEQRALEREVLLQSGSSAAGAMRVLPHGHASIRPELADMRPPPPPPTHTHTLSRARKGGHGQARAIIANADHSAAWRPQRRNGVQRGSE